MTDGSVKIEATISLGNYSSIKIEVLGIDGSEARKLLKEEFEKSIPMIREIMKNI